MRIGFNLEQLLYRVPGGTGRYTARLAAEYDRLFPDDELVPVTAWHRAETMSSALGRYGLPARLRRPHRIPLPRPILYESWHRLRFPPLTLAAGPGSLDLIHAPYPAVPPASGVPLVVTVHDAGYARHPEAYTRRGLDFHRRGVAIAAREADLVVTVSQAAADEISQYTSIPGDRIRVVPNGIDHARSDPVEVKRIVADLGIGSRPFVLWVGTIEPRKNVDTLVRAFARLVRSTDLPHDLILVGPDGWLLDGLIPDEHRAALGPRLRALGFVDDAQLRALYATADVFALPSRHEGFGIPVLEAMAQGTPVVCADIPALREVSGGAACLVPPDSVDRWTDALVDLLRNPGARAELCEAGWQRAQAFSWEKTAMLTHEVYREVGSAKASR